MPKAGKQKGRSSLLEKVRAWYLSDDQTGLVSAIRDSLKSLFAESRLPDNPYYYLARTLSAYVDQHQLWKQADLAIAGTFHDDGGLEMLDLGTRLCRLAGQGKAWGLPHTLRLVSKQGVSILHDVLTNSMPDSFFPGPTSYANEEGYAVQVLASVQGASSIWRPQWLEFPELAVRADVVVRGPRPDGALAAFADLIVADLQDLQDLPVYFITDVAFAEGLPTLRAAATRGATLTQPCMPLAQMIAEPDEWRRQLARAVLSNKVLEMKAVMMLETPVDGKNLEVRKHKFEMVSKRYVFHFVPSNAAMQMDNTTSYNAMALTASHFGTLPHEALYEGYFIDVGAARQYIMLWLGTAGAPYRQSNLTANMDQLMDLVEHNFHAGATLDAVRRLLMLVMLQDARILANTVRGASTSSSQGGVPGMLLTMEELLTSAPGATEQQLALQTVPNLIRMLNTGAAMLEGVVSEIEAVTLVSIAWPEKHARLLAAAATPDELTQAVRRRSQASNAGGCVDEQQMRLQDLRDTAKWLREFDMEGHLLDQLQALQVRIAEVTGGGVFSGISVLVDALMLRLGSVLSGKKPASASPERMQLHLQPLFASWTEADADFRDAYWRKRRHAHKNAAAGEWFSLEDIKHSNSSTGHTNQPPLAYNKRFSQDWVGGRSGREQGAEGAWSGPIWQQHTRAVLHELLTVLGAAGLTLADGLLDRCRNVLWVMHSFGLTACDDIMSRATAAQEVDAVVPEWVLNVSDVTEAQVRSGALAERVAVEGVMLQYAVDVKLDQMLSDCYRVLTEPPMPVNPYPQLLHFLRAYAARLELWKEDILSMCEQRFNQLTLLQPPSFIYAAAPPATAPTSALLQTSRARNADQDLGEEQLLVYGCYAAVTLCDVRAVHMLVGSMGGLLSERTMQSGAYDIVVLPALTGAAAISAALQLEDDQDSRMAALGAAGSGPEPGVEAAGRRQGATAAANAMRPPFEQPRWHGVESEEHHLIVGPACATAANLFATGVVDYAMQLHKDTPHLVQHIMVGSTIYCFSQLITEQGRQACIKALTAAAVKRVTQDQDLPGALQPAPRPLGHLQMVVAVREGLYVPMIKHLLFQYRGAGLPQTTLNTGDDSQRPGAIGHKLGIANCPEPHWPPGVYQRVFLTPGAAITWWEWNKSLGDPGQPYHVRHLLGYLQQLVMGLVHEQEAQGELLNTQKLLLLAGTASQDVELLYHVMHAMASKAQELHCLQGLNTTLVQLLTMTEPELLNKLDTEKLRRLVLLYTARLHRAARSPKYCYFSGFAASAPHLLASLKEEVLSSYKLTPEQVERMAQLQLWTRCCEVSVADSIHDCFSRDLIDQVLERAGLQDEEQELAQE